MSKSSVPDSKGGANIVSFECGGVGAFFIGGVKAAVKFIEKFNLNRCSRKLSVSNFEIIFSPLLRFLLWYFVSQSRFFCPTD